MRPGLEIAGLKYEFPHILKPCQNETFESFTFDLENTLMLISFFSQNIFLSKETQYTSLGIRYTGYSSYL